MTTTSWSPWPTAEGEELWTPSSADVPADWFLPPTFDEQPSLVVGSGSAFQVVPQLPAEPLLPENAFLHLTRDAPPPSPPPLPTKSGADWVRTHLPADPPPPPPPKRKEVYPKKQVRFRLPPSSVGVVQKGLALKKKVARHQQDLPPRRPLLPKKKQTAVSTKSASMKKTHTSKDPVVAHMDPIQRAAHRLLSQWAVPIQAVVRGFLARSLAVRRMCALINIQTYLRRWKAEATLMASKHAAAVIQGHVRGHQVRRAIHGNHEQAIDIQRVFRGYLARRSVHRHVLGVAATMIQAEWRGYAQRAAYQYQIVDIIIVQSLARRFLAKRQVQHVRNAQRYAAARLIQATWRGYSELVDYRMTIVDIMLVQTVARRWMAQLKLARMKKSRDDAAATKIQTLWRCFYQSSYYVIKRFEAIRIQAIVRGWQARLDYDSIRFCVVIIQAKVRQYQTKKRVESQLIQNVLDEGKFLHLRERNALKTIQSWWRFVLKYTREKKAALVIERFFIHVRAEVDREIHRQKRKAKEEKRRRERERRRKEEKLFEKAWSKAVAKGKSRKKIDPDGKLYSKERHGGGRKNQHVMNNVWLATSDEPNTTEYECFYDVGSDASSNISKGKSSATGLSDKMLDDIYQRTLQRTQAAAMTSVMESSPVPHHALKGNTLRQWYPEVSQARRSMVARDLDLDDAGETASDVSGLTNATAFLREAPPSSSSRRNQESEQDAMDWIFRNDTVDIKSKRSIADNEFVRKDAELQRKQQLRNAKRVNTLAKYF